MAKMIIILVALQICGCLSKSLEVPENHVALRAIAGDINKFSSEFYEVNTDGG